MEGIVWYQTNGLSSPIYWGFGGRATHLAGDGGDTPPPPKLLGRALTILLLLCGASSLTVIIVPVLIHTLLIPLSNGASVISSVRRVSPPLFINP